MPRFSGLKTELKENQVLMGPLDRIFMSTWALSQLVYSFVEQRKIAS